MRTRLQLVTAWVVGVHVAGAFADSPADRPLRAARSDNGRYELRVEPGRAGRPTSRPCRATLLERRGGRLRPVWSAKLANETAPTHASVSDDGRFVITLDEFRRGGAAHAAVVYGARGEKRCEFSLRELLDGDDWPHVSARGRMIEWLNGAEFAFDGPPPQYVIRLKWGTEVRIDLEKCELIRDERRPGVADASQIPPEVLAILNVTEQMLAERVAPGADAAGADGAAEDAFFNVLQQLIEQYRAEHGEIPPGKLDELIAQAWRLAAAGGIEGGGDAGQAAEQPPAPSVQAAAALDDSLTPPAGQAEAAEEGQTLAPPRPTDSAGISALTGVAVPLPRPGEDRVDYLAWTNEFTRVEGESAAPLYDAAAKAHVSADLDRELLDRALKGDPDALADSSVLGWLEANREALAQFREATRYEYSGIELKAADGMLISALLPSLGPMRELTHVSVVEGKRLESEGRAVEAVDLYIDALAAGAHAGAGVTLIENLVGVAMQRQASAALLDAYAAGHKLDYAALAEQLERSYAPPRPIAQTIQFERAIVLDVMQRAYDWNPDTGMYRVADDVPQLINAVTGMSDDPLGELAAAVILGAVGFERMVAQANEQYDRMTEATLELYPQARQTLDELDEQFGQPGFRLRNPLLATLLPSISKAQKLHTRGEATRRATLLVTQLQAHRQQHGVYPDSLDALPTGTAIDPFTEQPFVYRRDGDGFVLYSAGANGVDDGGVDGQELERGDLVYWPRPRRSR